MQFAPRQTRVRMPQPVQEFAWFDEICRASARVTALLPCPAAADAGQTPLNSFDPAPALDLLRQERFAEALNHVRVAAAMPRQDCDALLLEAVLLMHGGQIAAADDVVCRLLRSDGHNAAAHYIRALCREHEGAHERAIEHNRASANLDPTFAMPRLHLGLLMRRSGDREAARREFAQALDLFAHESESRILMFGGGLGRRR